MKPAPWPTGEPIPAACTVSEVLRITRIGRARFFQLQKIGALPWYIRRLPDTGGVVTGRTGRPRGKRPMFCGELLAAWVAGLSGAEATKALAAIRRGDWWLKRSA